jgi:hypothetical protein
MTAQGEIRRILRATGFFSIRHDNEPNKIRFYPSVLRCAGFCSSPQFFSLVGKSFDNGNLRFHAIPAHPLVGGSVNAARSIGDRKHEGNALGDLAIIYRQVREVRKAMDLLGDQSIMDPVSTGSCRDSSAMLDRSQGKLQS